MDVKPVRLLNFILIVILASWGQAMGQWQTLNGPPGARVDDLDRAPDGTLYLTSNLSLFKSVNNAESWQKIVPVSPREFDQLLIDGTDLYAVRYNIFQKSTDGGLNWEQQSANDSFQGMSYVMRFGPDNYFAVYGWGGLYISKDKGVTWTRILNRQPYDVKATASGDLYAAVSNDPNGEIIRYKYPGAAGVWDPQAWEQVYTNGRGPWDYRLLIVPSGKIYAAVVSDIIVSSNGNAGSWVSIIDRIVVCDFYNPSWGLSPVGTIALTNHCTGRLYSSSDEGVSWTSVPSPQATHGGNFANITYATGSVFFMGSDGDGVFKTTDGGLTWSQKSNGLTTGEGRTLAVANNGRLLYIDRSGGKGYWTSADDGNTWSFSVLPSHTNNILKLSDGKILLHSGGPVFRSMDDGASFSQPPNGRNVNTIVEDASGNLFGGDYQGLYKSSDKGETWVSLTLTGLPSDYWVNFITIDNATGILYTWLRDNIENKDKLYKIPSAGGDAAMVTEEPWLADNANHVNNVFFSDGKLYVTENNQFYASADGGSSWSTIFFSGERVFPIPGGLCVSRRGLLYVTQDGGRSWNSTTLPGNNVLITDIKPVSGGFVASASGSSALKFTGALILPPDQLPPFIDFNWQPTEGPYGGNVWKVFTDNSDNAYALAQGILYKTSIFNAWNKTSIHVNDAVYDASSNAIYALKHNQLHRSDDGGNTWNIINNESNLQCRNNLIKCSNGDIAFATGCPTSAIYVSVNGGITFGAPKYVLNNKGFKSLITTSTTGAIFLGLDDRSIRKDILLRSTDHGSSWTNIALPVENYKSVLADNSGNLYVLDHGFKIFRSADDGNSWTNISGNLKDGYFFFSSPIFRTFSGELYLGGYSYNYQTGEGLYKTADNGLNWTFIPTGFITQALSVKGTRIIAGAASGLFISDDSGVTFTERSNGIESQISGLELVNPAKLVALDHSNNSYATTDFRSWTKADLSAARFLKNPDGSLIAYSGHDFYKSNDKGESWFRFSSSLGRRDQLVTADGSLYFAASGTQIYYTEDFQTWNNLVVSGLPSGSDYYFPGIAANSSGSLFVILQYHSNGRREVYQIRFGSAIKFGQSVNPQNLLYSYEDDKVILYDGNGLIYETSDGATWSTRSAPSGGSKLIISEKNYFFIAPHGGSLWLSRDEGKTWQSVGLNYNDNLGFSNIVINEFTGYAYASLYNSVVHKSANIIMPEEKTAPALTALDPLNTQTGVSIRPSLSITFDEAVSAVGGKYIRILDLANPLIPVEVMDATSGVQYHKTFIFTPSVILNFNKTYFIVIDNGAFTDLFGNAFAGISSSSSWKFTTKGPPTLVSTTPSNNETNVGLNPQFSVTFTEAMLPVSGKKLFLYDAANTGTPFTAVDLQKPTARFVSLIPQGASPEQAVTVRFDARVGGKELLGASKVYMHSGIVERNTTEPFGGNGGDWRFLKGAREMTKVPGESDVWEITLSPTLREYFGVPPATKIYYLAVLFRSATGISHATPPETIPGTVIWNDDVFLSLDQGGSPVCSTMPVASGNDLVFPVCKSLEYAKKYFIKFEENAFVTRDGAVLSFLTSDNDWVFNTVRAPDAVAPAISYQLAHLIKGAVNKLQVTVTDNAGGSGVDPASVKVRYRGISSSGAFSEASLTPTSNNIFEVTVPDVWPDELGLEFKFEAADLDGNKAFHPAETDKYHRIYISYAEENQSVPSSVLSFGGKVENYRIFSIPFDLDNKLISSIFNELGNADQSLYRILTYKGNNEYIEYPSGLTTIERGVGYWINIRDQATLEIENAATPENSKDDLFTMTLKAGWNQIGNPYPFPISWEEVRKVNTRIKSLKSFNGTSFITDDKLNPFEGGFVFFDSPSNASVSIDIPFSAKTTSGGREREAEPGYMAGWLLPVRIKNDLFINDLCGIGMHPEADRGFDEYDDVGLPAFFTYPEIHFASREKNFPATITRDIVPVRDEFVWEFTVDAAAGNIVLEWENHLPPAKELFLFDEGRQRITDMLAENQYAADPQTSGKFKIYFGIDRNSIEPSRITLGKPYPNPAAGASEINFTLPGGNSAYHIALDVYDMLGRKMSTLVNGIFKPGFYRSQWDPSASASGVYFYRLTVFSSLNPTMLTEKIFISR